jgi:hypothetical protein
MNPNLFFRGENKSLLPLMFHFGELASGERKQLEMATPYAGEETVSHADGKGSYDTD